jgi:hypothetical protein
MQPLTIVLVLPRLSDILSPTIKGCTTVRAMEVDGEVLITVVLEPYNSLSALFHAESRPRRHAIIAYESGRLEPLVNLLLERFHIDLVEVDVVFGCLVVVCVEWSLVRRKR